MSGETKDTVAITADSLANIVAAASPFLGPYGALTALLAKTVSKLAPEIYADLSALAAKGEVTPEEEAALDAKIAKLKNPDSYFQ